MPMRLFVSLVACLVTTIFMVLVLERDAHGQAFGIELHNSMMPASGGMAGVSIAQPQDLQSAINGNPATLTQFHGTQFSFGGAWTEATYNISQLNSLPGLGITPFSAKSGTPGAAVGNIGVTQDFSALGLPATVGLAFVTNAGAGVDFRSVTASNGTSAHYMALDIIGAVGVDMTEHLALGASITLGSSFLDGPFVDTGGWYPRLRYGVLWEQLTTLVAIHRSALTGKPQRNSPLTMGPC